VRLIVDHLEWPLMMTSRAVGGQRTYTR